MVAGKPEKPWKNIAPKPDPDRLLSLDPKNIGSVEKTGPGAEYLFDADRDMRMQRFPFRMRIASPQPSTPALHPGIPGAGQ